MKRWLAIAVICYLAFGAALYWEALTGSRALFWHDTSIAYLPLRTSAAEAIRAGHLPLWESRMGNGFQVLAEGQAGVFYLPHLIGYAGLPQYHVYAILLVLHCVLAAVGAGLLCHLLGLRPMPCLFAGLVYGFSGFFVTHALHITIVEAAAYLPLAILCFEGWLRQPSRWIWLAGAALCLAVQQLAAMPQIFFYTVLATGLFALLRRSGPVFGSGRALRSLGPLPQRLVAWAGVVVFATLIAAVQILPTASLVGQSERGVVSAEKLRELSLAPHNLAYFIHPYIFGSYADGNYFGRDHYYEVCGFAGTIALLFGLVGAVHGSGPARLFAVVLVPLSLFMALAAFNPLYEVFPHIPGFSWFRGAGRYVLLSTLGLAILGAIGLHVVGSSRAALRTAAIGGLLTACVWLAAPVALRAAGPVLVPRLARMVDAAPGDPVSALAEAREKLDHLIATLSVTDPQSLLIFLCLLTPGVCSLIALSGRMDGRWLGEVAVALTAAQLLVFAWQYNPTIDTSYYTTQPSLASRLLSRDECVYTHDQNRLHGALPGDRGWSDGNLSYYWAEREALRPNRQVIYGLRSANVFYALAASRYWTLSRMLDCSIRGEVDPRTGMRIENPRAVLNALGAKVVCTPDEKALAMLPVIKRFDGWLARDNPSAVPLAYFADTVVPCWDEGSAISQLCAPGFDPLRPVVELPVGAELSIGSGNSGAEVIRTDNDCGHITVQCSTPDRAFLVVREAYDRRFQCRIDGVPSPTYVTNFLFRGVQVPAGEHTVEFIYRPIELWLGAVASTLGFLALLVGVAISQRRSRRLEPPGH